MEKNIIDGMNQLLTNVLDYKEVLQKLADSISDNPTSEKIKEFAKVADKESKELIQLISDLGGEAETTERQTDQASIGWFSGSPDTKDMTSVLEYLVEAERNREEEYSTVIQHDKLERPHKNRLIKHRKEAEANLKYFQTALQAK
ncbi:hypothetical protein [Pricia sp.]|uniref:hypothetical protein n=1 Tax=Pricia sp. TaxID=2268138 RepID=UPI0035947CD3